MTVTDARDVIQRALDLAKEPCITSSFQAECVVLTHMLRDVRPDIPVLFLDTFHHFAQTLAYRDEFTIALTDRSGAYRAFPTHQVKFTVDDPLQAHVEQLGKYTDGDMHDVLAYLQTLR